MNHEQKLPAQAGSDMAASQRSRPPLERKRFDREQFSDNTSNAHGAHEQLLTVKYI